MESGPGHHLHLVLHSAPLITDDPTLTSLKEQVTGLLQAQDSRLRLHDFRLVQGKRHSNLVFDVALPADLRGQEDAIQRTVEQALNENAAFA